MMTLEEKLDYIINHSAPKVGVDRLEFVENLTEISVTFSALLKTVPVQVISEAQKQIITLRDWEEIPPPSK